MILKATRDASRTVLLSLGYLLSTGWRMNDYYQTFFSDCFPQGMYY